jgi:hypothetical protein
VAIDRGMHACPMLWLNVGMRLRARVQRLPPMGSQATAPTFTHVWCRKWRLSSLHPHFNSVPGLGLSTLPDALMRYIRFLKTPRVVTVKGSSKKEVSCLITITSDLGDSFLPHNIELSAELLVHSDVTEEVAVWRTMQWTAGMRSLLVTFPLVKLQKHAKLLVRVGTEPKARHDEYSKLLEDGTRGLVSAWSQTFDPAAPNSEPEKLVERRFKLSNGHHVRMLEETGESIARHLWYVAVSLIPCYIR